MIIFKEDTFERLRRKFILTRCMVMYKTCGTKNIREDYIEGRMRKKDKMRQLIVKTNDDIW